MKLNRKNKLLITAFIIIMYVCYSFAFSATIKNYQVYNKKKEILQDNANTPSLLHLLKQKNNQLEKDLMPFNYITQSSFQNELLSKINGLNPANNLKITSFDEPHIFKNNLNIFRSYSFSLEGSFATILMLINALENDGTFGYIKHIAFTKKTNYETGASRLTAYIILQRTESLKSNQISSH